MVPDVTPIGDPTLYYGRRGRPAPIPANPNYRHASQRWRVRPSLRRVCPARAMRVSGRARWAKTACATRRQAPETNRGVARASRCTSTWTWGAALNACLLRARARGRPRCTRARAQAIARPCRCRRTSSCMSRYTYNPATRTLRPTSSGYARSATGTIAALSKGAIPSWCGGAPPPARFFLHQNFRCALRSAHRGCGSSWLVCTSVFGHTYVDERYTTIGRDPAA